MTARKTDPSAGPMAELIAQVVNLLNDAHERCATVECKTRGEIDASICARCDRLIRIDVHDGDFTMLCKPANNEP